MGSTCWCEWNILSECKMNIFSGKHDIISALHGYLAVALIDGPLGYMKFILRITQICGNSTQGETNRLLSYRKERSTKIWRQLNYRWKIRSAINWVIPLDGVFPLLGMAKTIWRRQASAISSGKCLGYHPRLRTETSPKKGCLVLILQMLLFWCSSHVENISDHFCVSLRTGDNEVHVLYLSPICY